MNPVVEREYAYLIKKATEAGDKDRVRALEKGLSRARARAAETSKS